MPWLIYIREPGSCIHESRSEQLDVETKVPGFHVRLFFLSGEKIEEQGTQSRLAQGAGHLLIARAEPAAAAPMREKHHGFGLQRNDQFTVEDDLSRGDGPFLAFLMESVLWILFQAGLSVLYW